MILRRTGFFNEMPHGEQADCSIEGSINFDYSAYDKQAICEYLKNGIVIISCGGTTPDVINENEGIAGCPEIMTDGEWLWPGDLHYYVSKYNVKLDSEFITHMYDKNFNIDISIEDIDFENLEVI